MSGRGVVAQAEARARQKRALRYRRRRRIVPVPAGVLLESALRECSSAQLKRALFAAEDLLSVAVRADDPTVKLEDDLVESLRDELKDRIKAIVQSALEQIDFNLDSAFTQEDLARVVDVSGSTFSDGFADAVGDDVGGFIDDAYGIGRDKIMASLGDDVVLDETDALAKEMLARDSMFWIDGTWDNELGDTIAKVISDTVLDEGLSRRDAANALETIFGEDLPDLTNDYWEVVASSGIQRARTFGVIGSLDQAGIKNYRVRGVEDDRMCLICGFMDGRIFQVADAVDQRDAWLDAENPEAAKKIHPWLTLEDIAGMEDDDLVEAGFIFAPFHGRCRCQTIPESVD